MEVYCIMKKRWGTPKAIVEEFEPNEYVAVCWEIACTVGARGPENYPNPDPKPWNSGQTHSHNSDGKGCGWAHSQYIREVGNDAFNVTEYGDNILPCSLTKKEDWSNLRSTISDVEPGDVIYWTTSLGNRTWYHYGTVGTVNSDHPNRS